MPWPLAIRLRPPFNRKGVFKMARIYEQKAVKPSENKKVDPVEKKITDKKITDKKEGEGK